MKDVMRGTEDTAGTVSRRKLLTATGLGAASGIAGCLGTTDNSDTNDQRESESSGDLSGEVVVTGSSTVYPISNEMATRFMNAYPDVTVKVESTGSGGGFDNHFCSGDADINGSSRPIKDEEVNHCTENGVEPLELRVAGDALTMAVNNEPDWIDCLSFDELVQIWGDGGADTWADVDPDWPDEEVTLYGPDTTSGTYDWFTEHVLGEDADHRSDYVGTEDDDLIVQGIEDDPYAIGYFGYSYYADNESRVTALEIKEREGDECGEPSLRAASNGTYPMARPLFIYPSTEALQREPVAEFVRFYLENSTAEWIAEEIGSVPASESQAEDNQMTVEKAVDG